MSDLRSIADEIASQADDFLAGAASREEARAGVAELLQADYPSLPAPDHAIVIREVMDILEAEDFFVGSPGGDGAGVNDGDEE